MSPPLSHKDAQRMKYESKWKYTIADYQTWGPMMMMLNEKTKYNGFNVSIADF